MFHGHVDVGHGLGLHPLGGVHQQEHALAGGQGPGHLVGKVHMPGGVDQIELKVLPGPAGVGQGDGVAFDGNAAFTLQIHSVQDLVPEIPVAYETGVLDEAIGQGGLAVIDVGDDAKVAGLAHGPPVRERAANRRLDLAPAPAPSSPGLPCPVVRVKGPD